MREQHRKNEATVLSDMSGDLLLSTGSYLIDRRSLLAKCGMDDSVLSILLLDGMRHVVYFVEEEETAGCILFLMDR